MRIVRIVDGRKEETTVFQEDLRRMGIAVRNIMSIFGFLFLALAFSDSFWRGFYAMIFWALGWLYFVTNQQRFFRAISQGIEGSYGYNQRISYFFQRAFERGERHFQSKGVLKEIGLFLASLVGIGSLVILIVIPIHLIWGIFSQFLMKDLKDLIDFFLLGIPAFVLFVWWAVICGVRLVRLFIELTGFSYRLLIRPPIKFFLILEDKIGFPVEKS